MRSANLKWIISYVVIITLTLGLGLIIRGAEAVSLFDNNIIPTPSLVATDSHTGEVLSRIQELMSTNFNCIAPCFAGLEPGVSTTNDIREFIIKIDYDNIISDQLEDASSYNFSLFFNEDGMLSVGLSTYNHILQRTRIGITNPNSWLSENAFNLLNVLNDLGSPENAFIAFSGPPLGFTMVLVYNAKGVLIRYQATFNPDAIHDNQPLPICFSSDRVDLYQIDVWLQNPENSHLIEKNQPGLRDTHQEVRPFWPLERVTGYNEKEFTKFFMDNPDGCVEALSPDELSEAGYTF